ncbi:MAG: oligosaccharide flippase family protein [Candidatus Levybacteria bacterium]|nr:oligosaccharide flippase family protein [Candidatus Levybacteria bacterium]
MGYKKDVIRGLSFIGSLRFLTKAVGFLETIILARILVPEQFGIYAIALLALGLLETITQTGVNVVLVQEKETDKYISSAWLISIVRGVVIMLVLLIAAPFIANFFRTPDAVTLLYWISIVPLMRGFINPAVVKLQKDLLFAKNFWYQMVILVIDTAVSIIATYLLNNPIGIVIGLLAGVIIELILSYMIVSPRPSFHFEKAYVSTIFHRGKWITGTAIFDYLFTNMDNIAVGRILGASSLGIYQLAYSLAVTPLVELGNAFNYVMFPIFSKLTHDRSRLRNAFIKMILGVAVLAIPFVIIFTVVPQIFVFILGEKWSAIISVLPILSLVGFMKAISNMASALFLSEIKQKYAMAITFVTAIGMFAPLIPLVQNYGIVGAAMAALIGSLVALPFYFYLVWQLLRKRV